MPKQKSKATKEKNPIADLQSLSLDTRRSIAKVLDVALRNFELDSFGYGDISNRGFYRLLFILDRDNKELNRGKAWTVLRGINKYIDGFQFIPTGVERTERDKEWLDLVQQLQHIRKTLGVTEGLEPGKKMVLYLTSSGDLYRDPRSQYCYRLRKAKMRLEIIKSLGYEFKATGNIQEDIGAKSKESVRKAIGKINDMTGFTLDLAHDLIESKPYSGYRVDPAYIIQEVVD